MRDLYHNIKVTQPLAPVVATTTKTSATIDLQGFDAASILFALGISADTLTGSVYWTLKLTHSDDDSSYSDVAVTELHNGAATVVVNSMSLDEASYNFGYAGTKRYLRAVATATGSHSSGTPMSMLAVLGKANYSPAV